MSDFNIQRFGALLFFLLIVSSVPQAIAGTADSTNTGSFLCYERVTSTPASHTKYTFYLYDESGREIWKMYSNSGLSDRQEVTSTEYDSNGNAVRQIVVGRYPDQIFIVEKDYNADSRMVEERTYLENLDGSVERVHRSAYAYSPEGRLVMSTLLHADTLADDFYEVWPEVWEETEKWPAKPEDLQDSQSVNFFGYDLFGFDVLEMSIGNSGSYIRSIQETRLLLSGKEITTHVRTSASLAWSRRTINTYNENDWLQTSSGQSYDQNDEIWRDVSSTVYEYNSDGKLAWSRESLAEVSAEIETLYTYGDWCVDR